MPRKRNAGLKRSKKRKVSEDMKAFEKIAEALPKAIALAKKDEKSAKLQKKPWLDPDDAPELADEFFQAADWYVGKKLVRRGRPPGPVPKRPVTIRLDTDVIAHFQAAGAGWQSRINAALRRAAGLSTPAK